jgi:hypothetical protein
VKKVRYAIGALGMAPALALPATHGGAPAPHQSASPAKRVRLTAEQNPAQGCFHQADHSGRAAGEFLSLYADWDGAKCVYKVKGTYFIGTADRVMRIRGRSKPNGKLVYSSFDIHGSIKSPDSTSFTWTVDTSGIGQICIAILTSTSSTAAGPQCVTT